MTQRAGQRHAHEGRHRSPWGRSGRILPIRWGRIVAISTGFVIAVGGLVVIGWGARGATAPALGRDGRVVAPMSVTASPDQAPHPGNGSSPGVAPGEVAAASGSPLAGDPGAFSGAFGSGGLADSGTTRSTGTGTAHGGPVLRLSRSVVDFGESITSDAVDLVSQGGAPVRFAVGPTPRWLGVTPERGQLDPDTETKLVIKINRAAAPVGVVQTDVRVSAVNGAGGGTIRVRASVSGPPKIISVVATPAVVRPSSCPAGTGSTVSNVRVVAEDPDGVRSVDVVARMPDGRTAATSLRLDDATGIRSTWSGGVGPAGSAGQVPFTVTVTDLFGLKVEAQNSLVVENCPG
jgi:hypothetical protein